MLGESAKKLTGFVVEKKLQPIKEKLRNKGYYGALFPMAEKDFVFTISGYTFCYYQAAYENRDSCDIYRKSAVKPRHFSGGGYKA